MNESTKSFRMDLIQNLTSEGFDIDSLAQKCGVPDEDIAPAIEATFAELCLRASADGEVTESELETLSRCGTLLRLSEEDQGLILTSAKRQVLADYIKQARADGLMSITEQDAIFQLRESLGLPCR